jgi:diguanylate cyclase (GGDEF)-like protein
MNAATSVPAAGHRSRALPVASAVFIGLVCSAALATVAPVLLRLRFDGGGWLPFGVFAAGIAAGHLFAVSGPRNQAHDAASLFLLAGVLVLPVELVALLGVSQIATSWLITRTWYKAAFNVSATTLAAVAASGAVSLTKTHSAEVVEPGLARALATVAGWLSFQFVGVLLLAGILHLVRAQPLRQSRVLSFENISRDLALNALGVALAQFWRTDPWLAGFALLPLLALHRSLHVPQLEEEARLDPKTRLANARHFQTVLAARLEQAERRAEPLSVIMADLDFLREINNTHGHRAGDAVLEGIAEVMRRELRYEDVAARVGGEEFAIVLAGVAAEQAVAIAERVRTAVAASIFRVEGTGLAIRATLSAGVAEARPGAKPAELVDQADVALYRAKASGRNNVVLAA